MPSFNPLFPESWEEGLWASMNKPKHYMRALHAYRGFRVTRYEHSLRLRSITMPYIWTGPTFRADKRPSKLSPFQAFTQLMHQKAYHGVYCLKLDAAPHYIKTWPAFGLLSLSGTVVEHTYGYRAEAVTLREVVIIKPDAISFESHVPYPYRVTAEGRHAELKKALPDLEDVYQCDVHIIPHIRNLIEEILPKWTLENPNE